MLGKRGQVGEDSDDVSLSWVKYLILATIILIVLFLVFKMGFSRILGGG